MTEPSRVSRDQVLAFRRRVGALDARLPPGEASVRRAAWAGLTDSVPRAALLQLHARVADTSSTALDDPALVQVWGPRFSTYVVPAQDRPVFTLGRALADDSRRRFAADLAERLDVLLDGRELPIGEAGRALGEHPNQLRYAATTGRVLIRWDGARQPTVRTVPAPDVDAVGARLELARRYLRVLGPGTAEGFGAWAGLRPRSAGPAFEALLPELVAVRTDVGDAWVLADDGADLHQPPRPTSSIRLLPSGDTFTLFHGTDRGLVVPDAARRAELWTTRVWPGAVLVGGEVVGTWRRADEKVTVRLWRPLPSAEREAVEREATSMPLPGLRAPVSVRWEG
ncbi:DNA glycosylase AlkZ-like family protein [Actinotalea sp. K2]|uniref:DNA glycosylase AlkZ-like family protein n=1 Tax=Actinotalea sp. K2 TaxID=2939438 RepID=UPI002017BB7B|nr:crosslink repair DNA glycosylase YcaQ family protein [Actinotalea sp. K2]MCL3861209.1 winged helix DNA-binding domain-containing protein [Actinotalea sp. K2]